MTIRVRIANEEPAGGDKVISIVEGPSRPHVPEIRLSGGQSFTFFFHAGVELHLTEADREPCDGPWPVARPREEP